MSRGPRKRRGYSIIEAMVSVALLSIGIVSIIGAYSALSTNQRKAIESERMQRLALDKYDELVATGSLQTEALSGDFSDRGDDRYVWDAAVEQTGQESLSALTITVTPRDSGDNGPKAVISGAVYLPPQTTGTAAPTGGTP